MYKNIRLIIVNKLQKHASFINKQNKNERRSILISRSIWHIFAMLPKLNSVISSNASFFHNRSVNTKMFRLSRADADFSIHAPRVKLNCWLLNPLLQQNHHVI